MNKETLKNWSEGLDAVLQVINVLKAEIRLELDKIERVK